MRPLPLVVAAALFAAPAQAAADCDVAAAVDAWAADWRSRDAVPLHADAAFELQVTDTGQSFRVALPMPGHARVLAATDAAFATRFSPPPTVYSNIASRRMTGPNTLCQAPPSHPTPTDTNPRHD